MTSNLSNPPPASVVRPPAPASEPWTPAPPPDLTTGASGASGTVLAAPPADKRTAAGGTGWVVDLRRGIADRVEQRGISASTLAFVALTLGAVAAACLAIQHHGLGGLLGLAAVAVGWIARTPPRADDGLALMARPFVQSASEVLTAALASGLVLDAAANLSPAATLMRLAVLVMLLLLPLIRYAARDRGLPAGATMWTWGERLGVLMLGSLLGNPMLATFLLLVVLGADVLLRFAYVRPRSPLRPTLPLGVAPAFDDEGRLRPVLRWGSLGVCVLLFLLFGTEGGWRF